jgi:hypothetical protein
MYQPASNARTWAVVSVVGSVLALVGFFVPWFFATDPVFRMSGEWITMVVLLAPFQPYFTFFSFYILIALLLLLGVAGLVVPFVSGLSNLLGRPVSWLSRLHLGLAWAALIALLLGVGIVECIFQIAQSFDTSHSNAMLIPGVGVWLMFLGFVMTIISGQRVRRASSMPPAAA